MLNLLMVIASLHLVECYSTKSEIRFGYVLLYEHRQLLHGLNKYNLLVGVEMQKFTLLNTLTNWNSILIANSLLI